MKKFRSTRLIFLVLISVFWSNVLCAAGSFIATKEGIRYVIKDSTGATTKVIKPTFDPSKGKYIVKDSNQRIIAAQQLPTEAAMNQFKIVTPMQGDYHSVTTKDFMGNDVPVLKPLSTSDPRYQQLKGYIENNAGLRQTVQMQVEARNFKVNEIQKDLTAGTKDPAFAKWLTNDLKKPVYLEVGNSGSIYHDPRGFVLAENTPNGQITYRDNSNANRLVVPPNSEVFEGGMKDPSAASVMAHEVGHMIMDQLYERPNYPKTDYHGAHSKNTISDEGFALSEGWAEAIEALSTKEHHNSAKSWRIKTHKNIAENKYIFKNQGVVSGPNDGIINNGANMMKTEGVNASLFYDMLNNGKVQQPYTKVMKVFENTKPQTYREFVNNFIKMYPEDRSQVIKQFLNNTKYATIDSSATSRYKALHDAKQAYLSATDPSSKAQLKAQYDAQLNDYKKWSNDLYKKTVVDGKLDDAIQSGSRTYSDDTPSQYRSIRLSETLLKSKKALGVGLKNAASSIKQSFSVKNLAMTAGTSIAINLASQIMNGEKPSVKTALKSVASLQFVGNVVGSTLGAAAGQVVTPLISTFVPIPIVGTIAGALIPTMTAIAGGSFGGNLGAGMTFKQALKALDPVAIAGQALGSTVGAMLGSLIPIPIVGTMIGSIVGGILGEKLFKSVAKLFGYKKKTPQTLAQPGPEPSYMTQIQSQDSAPAPDLTADTTPTARDSYDPYGIKLPNSVDKIPYNEMHPNLKRVKDIYENAYKAYVKALTSGDQTLAKKKLAEFQKQKARYKRVLGAYTK